MSPIRLNYLASLFYGDKISMQSFYFVPLYDKRINLKRGYLSWAKKADCIIFDLEDSLAIDKKDIGRKLLREAFEQFKKLNKVFFIRINSNHPYLDQDLEFIKNFEQIKIILPKVQSLKEIDYILSKLGSDIKISILIETPMAIINCENLVAHPNVEYIFFGPEDLSNLLNVEPTEKSMLYSASRLINAAAAYHKKVIGCLGAFRHISINGLAKYKSDLYTAKEIGFAGAFAIHYKQIDLINEVYRLTLSEVNTIQKKLKQHATEAVYSYHDEIIGPPMLKRYQKIIEKK